MTTIMSQSAEIVGSIDDLLLQILLCLPVKSLIRFEVVSKHWQSLVKNPEFRHLFSSRQDPTVVGLFVGYSRTWINHYVDYIPFISSPMSKSTITNLDWFRFQIDQSCNGLLFCRDNFGWSCFVCNPCTRQVSDIPEPHRVNGCVLFIESRTLCFDPAKSPYYKIVCVLKIYPPKERQPIYQIQIYSSSTRQWSVSGSPLLKAHIVQAHGNGVYWNGAVHWLGGVYSLYFNIEDGVLNTFPSPPISDLRSTTPNNFWESCDNLHYVVEHWQHLNLYELKRDRSEWFIKHQVNLSAVTTRYPVIIRRILSVVRGNEERDSFVLIIRLDQVVVRYNSVFNTFQELHRFEKNDNSLQVFQHIESLWPV